MAAIAVAVGDDKHIRADILQDFPKPFLKILPWQTASALDVTQLIELPRARVQEKRCLGKKKALRLFHGNPQAVVFRLKA